MTFSHSSSFIRLFLRFFAASILGLLPILYSCAVNSKEAAVSLPAILLVFQLLRNPPRSVSWIWREARAVLATGGVGLIYLWARFTSPNNLLGHPAYTPAFSVYRYLESTAYYLNELSSQEHLWTTAGAAVLLLSMAAIALLARSRDLWFAWLLIVVGSAPIAFVLPRGVAAYYIPLVGYALFIAIVLVRTREFLFRARSAALALASQGVLFVMLFATVWRWQIHHQRRFPDYWKELAAIDRRPPSSAVTRSGSIRAAGC